MKAVWNIELLLLFKAILMRLYKGYLIMQFLQVQLHCLGLNISGILKYRHSQVNQQTPGLTSESKPVFSVRRGVKVSKQ